MALLFQTPIILPSGITIENAYGRVLATDNVYGKTVGGLVEIFVSEAAFEAGAQSVSADIRIVAEVPYDRATDGVDILAIAHDALIAKLAEQGITVTKEL